MLKIYKLILKNFVAIYRYINILKWISYTVFSEYRIVSSSLNHLIIILDNIINNYSFTR